MNSNRVFLTNLTAGLMLAAAGCFVSGFCGSAQDVRHLSMIQPGGMPGAPMMTGIQQTTNGVQVTWDGPPGYYQLWHKANLKNSAWLAVGKATNLNQSAIVTTFYSNDFFRVSGPSPRYAGAQVCAGCHAGVHSTVMSTAHAGAFTSPLFVASGGQTNAACLACHTVGYGLPTGFVSASQTPQLEGVQCESCHGPAANHAANPGDPTVVPRVDIAAEVCGGCHNAQFISAEAAQPHSPIYEDWNSSAHHAVLPPLKADFASAGGPTFYIPTCGRCHSGTVAEALMENAPIPDAHEAGAVGIACATCHDPHESFVRTNEVSGVIYTNQIRFPLASLQDYHASGSATNLDPDINVCAQCHNDRGASTNDVTYPPHHSPQYNMLLGTFSADTGVTPGQPAAHAMLESQCVTCHMQTPETNDLQLGTSGHTFEVTTYNVCLNCHPNPQGLVDFTTSVVSNQIQQVKALLDQWALTKAPALLQTTNYGALAWEYTNPGELSAGTVGPNSDEQKLIPGAVQQARLDLYLVFRDGSYGVHNPPYAITLLNTAQSLVQGELNK